ncbi:MAG TPA: ABC transporter permease [Elusimicrobiales bacterium]|nr:ABC transporter permease [Elusimicrobiales bacterium]
MNKAARTAVREARRLIASRPLLFLLAAWPLFYGLFLGSIYSARVVTEMPAAVCDEDRTAMSRLALRYIDATRSIAVKYRAADAAQLQAYILSGKAETAIYIPRGFSSGIKRGKPGVITAYVNGANLLVANIALSELRTAAGTIAAGARVKFLRKTGSSGAKALAAYAPVKVDSFKLFNPGGNYLNYLLPGIWATILQQLLLAFGGLSLAGEKDEGTLGRARRVAGGPVALLAGKALPYAAFFMLVFAVFDLAIFPFFSIPRGGSALLLSGLNALFIYAALGAGFLISAASEEGMDALKGVLLIGAPALLLSGYIWPVSYMPWFVKPFALLIPLTHYLGALRTVTQYGAGITYILPQAAALLATGTLCFGAAWLKLRGRRA